MVDGRGKKSCHSYHGHCIPSVRSGYHSSLYSLPLQTVKLECWNDAAVEMLRAGARLETPGDQ